MDSLIGDQQQCFRCYVPKMFNSTEHKKQILFMCVCRVTDLTDLDLEDLDQRLILLPKVKVGQVGQSAGQLG